MFDDFSFAASTTRSTLMDDSLPPPFSHEVPSSSSPSSSPSPLDEGYCSSTSDPISDLSTRFDHHSLRPRPPPHYHRTSPTLASSSNPQLHSVRHARQLATRRQCSTENLARISLLVERMLHENPTTSSNNDSITANDHPSTARPLAHHHSSARLSLTAPSSRGSFSSAGSSPLRSPTSSSTYDSESDYGFVVGQRGHNAAALKAARSWGVLDAGRGHREGAVEKVARMRKRPGGRTGRRRE
ncbi:hypothetical protein MMC34_007636 [Xylographa carneopallida]|nr:hypothetical protein [Xylographa carneopallida]